MLLSLCKSVVLRKKFGTKIRMKSVTQFILKSTVGAPPSKLLLVLLPWSKDDHFESPSKTVLLACCSYYILNPDWGRGRFCPFHDFFDRSTLKDRKSGGHGVSKSKLLYWEDT